MDDCEGLEGFKIWKKDTVFIERFKECLPKIENLRFL